MGPRESHIKAPLMHSVASPRFLGGGGANILLTTSAETQAYKGVWEQCPQWGQGAKSRGRESGGLHLPETETFLFMKIQIFTFEYDHFVT